MQNRMGDFRVLLTAEIILSVVAIFIHTIGITVLLTKRKRTSQTIIITNLSMAEILYILNNFVNAGVTLANYNPHGSLSDEPTLFAPGVNIYVSIYGCIHIFCACQVILCLILLTFDRLICVISPFHYAIKAEENSLFKFLLVVSLCISLVSGLLTLSKRTIYFNVSFGYFITIFEVVFIGITYFIIAVKINSSKKRFNDNSRKVTVKVTPSKLVFTPSLPPAKTATTFTERVRRITRIESSRQKFSKHHLVVALIALTYFTFFCISLVLKHFFIPSLRARARATPRELMLIINGIKLLPIIGVIADAAIYIFLNEENRSIFMDYARKCCRRRCSNDDVSITVSVMFVE